MNRFAFVIISLFVGLCCVAQTFEIPRSSIQDTVVKTLLPYQDAGAAGREMIWNFKSLSAGEDYPVFNIRPNNGDTTTTHRIEHNSRYYWHWSNDSLFLAGFENATTYMPYIQPELRMKRFMLYGDTIHSVFSGNGEYGHLLPLSVNGITDVTVDAYGTLILPEDTVRNVFRLHTIRRYSEIFSDTTNLETHIWQWYSPYYTCPVFESMRTLRINQQNSLSDTVVYSASVMFSPSMQNVHVVSDRKRAYIQKTDNTMLADLRFAPNPVIDNLYIEYILTCDADVSFQIFSPLGISIYNNSFNQKAGSHLFTIPMAGLITGAYTLYIKADDLIVRKIILKQ